MIENRENNNYPTIGGSMKGIGSELSSNIPHIMLGKGGLSTKSDQKPEQYPRNYEKASQNPPNHLKGYISEPPTDNLIEKLKKWGLTLAVLLVVGFAGYRIINSILT